MDASPDVVDPIEAVAARMESIAAPLAEDDGVRRFNELYLAVTRAVVVAERDATFEDAAFLSRLDVVFADLYFAAIDDLDAGRKPSRAWAPLFEARAKKGIAPLQFAIAGMNAHINYDLVLALITTTKELGCGLDRDTPQHRDYVAVDRILQRVQDEIKTASRRAPSGTWTGPEASSMTSSPAGRSRGRVTTPGRRRRSSTRSATAAFCASSS